MTSTSNTRHALNVTGAENRLTTYYTEDTPQTAPEASWQWRAAAESVLLLLAERMIPFTADDVRAEGVGEPHHPNQWGVLFSTAHRAGWITPVATATSVRRSRNAGLNRVWTGVADD